MLKAKNIPSDPQLNFLMDFSEDYAERRATELLDRDKDDDEAA